VFKKQFHSTTVRYVAGKTVIAGTLEAIFRSPSIQRLGLPTFYQLIQSLHL